MPDFSRQFHEIFFQRDYLLKGGDEFQDFFSAIMEKQYPGDFVRVRAWGSVGDKKSDGYLRSEGRVFQCYGPNSMSASEAITKIDKDFFGAAIHWPDMKGWTFVHNSFQGLGPDVLAKILALQSRHPKVDIRVWGFEELRQEVFKLKNEDRNALLGAAPTVHEFSSLGFEDIQPVIEHIETQQLSMDLMSIRPVPSGKIEHNKLSPDSEALLRVGMVKFDLVDRYFDSHTDPTLGDRLAQAVSSAYIGLKQRGFPADVVLGELQEFLVGDRRATPMREAAALSVLAYFFVQCDIFERPPTDDTAN